MAEHAPACVVLEKLQTKNMTKHPKVKKIVGPSGQVVGYEKNRATQKAGLNRAILNVGWASLQTKLAYKLQERSKILWQVEPHYSSQECSACGHTSAENRKTQELFRCTSCGYEQNADVNAACVLKKRFLTLLRNGKLLPKNKAVQKISMRRQSLESTVGIAGTEACGGRIRPDVSLAAPKKQETLGGNIQIVGEVILPESRPL